MSPTARIEADGERTAAGALRAGRFSYRRGTRTVWWSAPAAPAPGVPAAVEQMAEHAAIARVHPDDRGLLAQVLNAPERRCLRLRVLGTKRGVRTLIVISEPAPDGVDGCYVDLTADLRADGMAVVDESVTRFVADRAVVERAVGMLLLVYGIPADRAREILAWRATETGVPVEELAARLCAAVSGHSPAPTALRSRFDDLLLTVRDAGSG
ncbi:ANTAR domain-containing protein [Nocardia asteroides]|uniref:ANTAR domain-containing protein n=1 Tax=Nocardia asteroides TaxID=1824 RepID=UPI001E2B7341|nr:ANTAR domain-containing protein [Nocardia asteroides]UGT62001.1 ANTAR domain-containing protein [Nocardia asteroides]